MGARSHEFNLWLSAARSGSKDALGRALEACRRYLLGVARYEIDVRLKAKVGLSDLVQDTFLEAQRAFTTFRGHSEVDLRAWLRRLLQHQASKLGRRYRTTQKRALARESMAGFAIGQLEISSAETPTPSVELIAEEQLQRLFQAVEKLPDDYRRVIRMRYVERISFEEIGRRMQRSGNAARLLWLRAIERIKQELESSDEC